MARDSQRSDTASSSGVSSIVPSKERKLQDSSTGPKERARKVLQVRRIDTFESVSSESENDEPVGPPFRPPIHFRNSIPNPEPRPSTSDGRDADPNPQIPLYSSDSDEENVPPVPRFHPKRNPVAKTDFRLRKRLSQQVFGIGRGKGGLKRLAEVCGRYVDNDGQVVVNKPKPFRNLGHVLRAERPLCIPRTCFARLVKEILEKDCRGRQIDPPKFQSVALTALQEVAESFLTNMFEDANLYTQHAKRVTLMVKDIKLQRRVAARNIM